MNNIQPKNWGLLADVFNGIVNQFEKIVIRNANRIIDYQAQKYCNLSNQIAQLQKTIQGKRQQKSNNSANDQFVPEKGFKKYKMPQQSQIIINNGFSNQISKAYPIYRPKISPPKIRQEQFQNNLKNVKMISQKQSNRNIKIIKMVQTNQPYYPGDKFENSKILSLKTTKNQLQALTNQLQAFKIHSFKPQLIYRFPNEKKLVNFHKNFDLRPNILLLVSLKNGNIISAFSSLKFQKALYPEDFLSESFFIANLNKRLFIYPSLPSNKGIKYEQFHIIFGNNELMIKNRGKILKIGFNRQKGYYEYPKQKQIQQFQNQFLGENSNGEAEIEEYEIYQLNQQGQINNDKYKEPKITH